MDSLLYLDAVACFGIKIEKDAVIVIGYPIPIPSATYDPVLPWLDLAASQPREEGICFRFKYLNEPVNNFGFLRLRADLVTLSTRNWNILFFFYLLNRIVLHNTPFLFGNIFLHINSELSRPQLINYIYIDRHRCDV